MTAVATARHRLRRARRRSCAPCSAPAVWPTRSRSATCRPTSTTGRSGSCLRSTTLLDRRAGGRPVLRRLRRLRHRRRARPLARRPSERRPACPARTATSSSPAPTLFAALHDDEPGTFFLTDFLAKHFDAARVAGARPRSPSRAARHVLRQLPAGRAAVAVRAIRPSSRPAGPPPSGSGSTSSIATSGAAGLADGGRCRRLAAGRPDGRAGRRDRELVVIYWRDIPAQVNGQVGRERHQVLLSDKFQRAVDRAKRKAQHLHRPRGHRPVAPREPAVRRRSRGGGQALADRIEREYTRDRLGMLAFAGGWEADVVPTACVAAELAALEELDDDGRDDASSDGRAGRTEQS